MTADSKAAAWLVDNRFKVHQLLLELWTFGEKSQSLLVSEGRERELSIYGLFVGAAFSLWRAAFYIPEKKAPTETLGGIIEMLQRVVTNNSFTYDSEKVTKDWSGGFYLNNARYRLLRIRDKMNGNSQFDRIKDSVEFNKLEDILKPYAIDDSDHMRNWEILFAALRLAFPALRDTCHSMKTADALPTQVIA